MQRTGSLTLLSIVGRPTVYVGTSPTLRRVTALGTYRSLQQRSRLPRWRTGELPTPRRPPQPSLRAQHVRCRHSIRRSATPHHGDTPTAAAPETSSLESLPPLPASEDQIQPRPVRHVSSATSVQSSGPGHDGFPTASPTESADELVHQTGNITIRRHHHGPHVQATQQRKRPTPMR